MQTEVPSVLSVNLRISIEEALLHESKDTVVLIDRWFSDIIAYTHLEMPPEEACKLDEGIEQVYRKTLDELEVIAGKFGGECFLTHVFVPTHTCGHVLPQGKTAEKSHRASGSAEVWEGVYDRVSRRFTPDQRTHQIASSDRLRRAAEIIKRTVGESPA